MALGLVVEVEHLRSATQLCSSRLVADYCGAGVRKPNELKAFRARCRAPRKSGGGGPGWFASPIRVPE